jgi:hypothetical protein
MKGGNMHTTRESWLRSATAELRPLFEKLGYQIPEKIRFAIAFTSGGKRTQVAGECWHPASSEDQHYEIIIRADQADPIDVLGVLAHELVHSVLPPAVKHGKEFRLLATKVGLEGKMRYAKPGPILKERLNAIAGNLGPLPHAKLNFVSGSDVPKKQKARMLKAECGKACGYTIRLTAKWAREGLPVCPLDARHGRLACDVPEDDEDESAPPKPTKRLADHKEAAAETAEA